MASPYQRKLYEQHKDLFMLIMRLGNKVAVQNQLRVLCLKLKLYTDRREYNDTIAELHENNMISYREDIYSSKSNLIVVENPVLTWVYEELKEKGIKINKAKVKGTPTDRVDKSLFKIQYAINFLDRNSGNNIDTVDALLESLGKYNSILFTEKRGLEYFNFFVENNKKSLHIDESECIDIRRELSNINKKQKESVPSRKGKGKDYKAKKEKDINIDFSQSKEIPSDIAEVYITEKNQKEQSKLKNIKSDNNEDKVEFENNFNSFLERGCIVSLNNVKTIPNLGFKEVYKEVHFTLYILDIAGKLNAYKVAEKTSRAYLMLDNFLKKGHFYRDNRICKQCKKNINNESYERIRRSDNIFIPIKDDEQDINEIKRAFYYCNPNDRNDNDYKTCKDNKVRLRRKIYVNAVVLTWNEKRRREILADCNHIKDNNYLNNEKKDTNFEKICKTEGLYSDDLEKIKLSVVDYNLEYLYLGGKSRNNIKRANEKSSTKRMIKNKIKKSEIELNTGESSTVSLDDETIEKIADVMVAKMFKKNKKG